MTSTFPKISFSVAMKSTLLLPEQGELVSVEACSGPDFRAWIEHTLAVYQNTKRVSQTRVDACTMELAGLSYQENVAKWFAILVLQEHKIPMDLCASQKNVVVM